jgi:hypothetical protein
VSLHLHVYMYIQSCTDNRVHIPLCGNFVCGRLAAVRLAVCSRLVIVE